MRRNLLPAGRVSPPRPTVRDGSLDERIVLVLEQVMVDPRGARTAATVILAQARAGAHRPAEVRAHRALGWAARQLQAAGPPARQLRRAIRLAGRYGLAVHRAEARMS